MSEVVIPKDYKPKRKQPHQWLDMWVELVNEVRPGNGDIYWGLWKIRNVDAKVHFQCFLNTDGSPNSEGQSGETRDSCTIEELSNWLANGRMREVPMPVVNFRLGLEDPDDEWDSVNLFEEF